ncbi:MAG: aldehyde dehydrogenase family protein [Thermoanaerobaculaceae bacterium]|jgi:acyl-CoA reductase-like NAD-dependent aldehyde dehydrogenase
MAFVKPRRGSAAIPEIAGSMPHTSLENLDRAVEELAAHKDEWARMQVGDRLAVLGQVHDECAGVVERWVAVSMQAKGITPGTPSEAEEWLAGPLFLLRNLRLLRRSLQEIARYGHPKVRGRVTTRPSGQVSARVFPADIYDRIFFRGFTGDVWMEPGVAAADLPKTQALAYKQSVTSGKVALVLGAGNVSSIGPMDALYKLFVEKQVVVLKMNPVNAYLGPLVEEGFRALIARGFLHVAHGGAAEGAYLCAHPEVDEIHITGSDRTHDAIVFGTGDEGARRKAERRPLLTKRVTSELGNVSPVIVVPGPWTERDFRFHAANIVAQLVNNAGFNCNAVRVVVQHEGWDGREKLLAAIRALLATIPPRQAYYPGAAERWQAYVATHPKAEHFGTPRDGELPWVLAAGLDPAATEDICFTQEAFCGVASETALGAADAVEFLDRAVAFANDTLWGTLNVGLIVHPKSLRDPRVAAAVDRAIENLRFGTVTVNHWAAAGYAAVTTPWGAFSGSDIYDVKSGIGEVHNTLMFSRVQKNVVRGPFHVWPVPPWFPTCRTGHVVARRLTEFEARPSLPKLAGILAAAVRG